MIARGDEASSAPTRRKVGAWRCLGLFAAGLVTLVVGGRPVDAHATLVATQPADGAVISAPDTIVLRFREPVEAAGSHISVQGAGGVVDLGAAAHPAGQANALTVPMPALEGGAYTVAWHVVAADAMAMSGTFTVTVEAAPGAVVEVSAPVDVAPAGDGRTAALPTGVIRLFLDASLATFMGGLAFVATVWPPGAPLARTRRLLWGAAMVSAIATFLLAATEHANATGLDLTAALSPAHLVGSLQFRFGRVAAARVALLVAGCALTSRLARGGAATARSLSWCLAMTVLVVGLCETVALVGHTGQGGGLSTAARLVHTLGVSVWLGGLVMLCVVVLPRRRHEELVSLLPRFSILATAAVAALGAAGLVLATDLVGVSAALPTSAYGRVLLAKLAVVAALLLAAHRSRAHVRLRLQAVVLGGGGPGPAPLALLVGTELALMAVVFALTALLVAQSPPG